MKINVLIAGTFAVLACLSGSVQGQRMQRMNTVRQGLKPIPPPGKEFDFPTCEEAEQQCQKDCVDKDARHIEHMNCIRNGADPFSYTCHCDGKGGVKVRDNSVPIRERAAKAAAEAAAKGKRFGLNEKSIAFKIPDFSVYIGQEPDLSIYAGDNIEF